MILVHAIQFNVELWDSGYLSLSWFHKGFKVIYNKKEEQKKEEEEEEEEGAEEGEEEGKGEWWCGAGRWRVYSREESKLEVNGNTYLYHNAYT